MCGSEEHRKKECPHNFSAKGQGQGKGNEGSPKSTSNPATSQDQLTLPISTSTSLQKAQVSSDTQSTASTDVVQGDPMTLEGLIRAAQQIVQAHSSGGEGMVQSPVLKVLSVQRAAYEDGNSLVSGMALVDTGAPSEKSRVES